MPMDIFNFQQISQLQTHEITYENFDGIVSGDGYFQCYSSQLGRSPIREKFYCSHWDHGSSLRFSTFTAVDDIQKNFKKNQSLIYLGQTV